MKKIFLLIIAFFIMVFPAAINAASYVYNPITGQLNIVPQELGTAASPTWLNGTFTGTVTAATGTFDTVTADSISTNNPYSVPNIMPLVNSSQISPKTYSGDGLFIHNGTLLYRTTTGATTRIKKASDDSTWGTYLEEIWKCDQSTGSYTETNDWDTSWNTPTEANHPVTLVDSSGCTVIQQQLNSTVAGEGHYLVSKSAITAAKTQRIISIIKLKSPGIARGASAANYAYSVLGIVPSLDINDTLVLKIFYGVDGATFTVYANTINNTSPKTRAIVGYDFTSWVVVEMYRSGTSFYIMLNGTVVANSGAGVPTGAADLSAAEEGGNLSIRALSSWSTPVWNYSNFGTNAATRSGDSKMWIKQHTLFED